MRPDRENEAVGRRALLGLTLAWEAGRSAARTVGRALSAARAAAPPPEPERIEDRDLAPLAHLRWGTAFAACAFAVAAAAGIGFLWVYWNGASHMLLGGTLALFLAGLGVALVIYARWLIPNRQADEPRESLVSPAPERAAAAADFSIGAHQIHRRGLLGWIAAAAALLPVAIVISLFRSLGKAPGPVLFSQPWRRGQHLAAEDGTRVSIDSLQPGSTMVVFPEDSLGSERAQTVLIRVDERLIPANARANWAPKGYLAYSRVCTHAGCPVGLYEVTTCLLMCPCHQSTFDVLRGASPTSGPAARPLPQLPLYVDDAGFLHAADSFTTPPGPGFWGMPPSPPAGATS
jgi:ubiquinol-cytochrome c reductase iron-sulfur subunit